MGAHRIVTLLLFVAIVCFVVLLLIDPGSLAVFTGDQREGTVIIQGNNETEDVVVSVRVVTSKLEQYIGLADTDSLEGDEGMFFKFEQEAERTVVMRGTAVPLDIMFIDATGRITAIHQAPVERYPPFTRYSGTGQYILEVPYGFAERNNVTAGDHIEFRYDD